MTINLTPAHQRMIERALHSRTYPDAEHVIGAALEAFAGDMDDVAVTKSREHEPRVSLMRWKPNCERSASWSDGICAHAS